MAVWKSTNYETRNRKRQIKRNVTILTRPAQQDCGILNFIQANVN